MTGSETTSRTALAWAGVKATLWLTLGLLAFRVVYLMTLCPYEIVADEAHYWDWSRNLSWSYYTKGPGVAWTIWAGPRSVRVTHMPQLSRATTYRSEAM